ncbi:rod-binding protein [Mariniblastus fucicola]|uniref:Peptidoglycan hydrolase FlgJ n=1 Tax=Mariniblastus fucicola TaxID=980251 RepID=A0A5B9PES2_9BACT|nr:rod-binding protein [Mariniblastus fucicola]QEG23382.1 Peptidoglycan hydrolase FlgJ [Mariniblastus fucicola]
MNQIGNSSSLISSANFVGTGIEKYASINSAGKSSESDAMLAKMESLGQEFEGVFLSLMLKEMRNTLEDGGFFGEETSDTYGGMFDMFVGQDMAKSSPLGIADMLVKNYSRQQSNPVAEQSTSVDPAQSADGESVDVPVPISITI